MLPFRAIATSRVFLPHRSLPAAIYTIRGDHGHCSVSQAPFARTTANGMLDYYLLDCGHLHIGQAYTSAKQSVSGKLGNRYGQDFFLVSR